MSQLTTNNFFINNSFGSFLKGVLNWVYDCCPRMEYRVIGSYDKSVEFFNKKQQFGKETNTNILPSVTLDPSYDFINEESAGKFPWQFETLSPGLAIKLFDKIEGLDDQNITIVPVYTRYKGTFDLVFWVESIYEYLDLRTFLIQTWGGTNRILKPGPFDSYISMPNSIYTYSDDDIVEIDWSGTPLHTKKIDSTGNTYYVLDAKIDPWLRLQDITDSSNKYGGDNIAEYKLSAAIEYEVNLPTFITMQTNSGSIGSKIDFNMSMDVSYSKNNLDPDQTSHQFPAKHLWRYNLENLEERAFYKFDGDDVSDEDGYFTVTNPFFGKEYSKYVIVSFDGLLKEGSKWEFVDETENEIKIKIEPEEHEIIEFYRYKEE